MASIEDRLGRLEWGRAPSASEAAGPPPDYTLLLKLLHNNRVELDRADREALGPNPDFDFGGPEPEPEPLTLGEKRALLAAETSMEGISTMEACWGVELPELREEARERAEKLQEEIAIMEAMEGESHGEG